LTLDIPSEQIERLQPVVDALLADLRKNTHELTPDIDLALAYRLEPGAGS
jgi:hypothetical protein